MACLLVYLKAADPICAYLFALFLLVFFVLFLLLFQQALQKEAAFFRDHPSYRGLDKRVGTTNLSKTLNQVRRCLLVVCCVV